MADFQHIKCKNYGNMSPNRPNYALCKEILVEKSNDSVRNFTGSLYIADVHAQ